MSKQHYCPVSTMLCNPDNCPLYSPDHDACKIKLALDKYLGMDATPEKSRPQPLVSPQIEPFPELKPKTFLPEIIGELVDNPETKEVETTRGPTLITNFHITDGKEKVRVAIWGDLVKEVEGYTSGDVIKLENVSVKDIYEGVKQISSNRKTIIKS